MKRNQYGRGVHGAVKQYILRYIWLKAWHLAPSIVKGLRGARLREYVLGEVGAWCVVRALWRYLMATSAVCRALASKSTISLRIRRHEGGNIE